MYGKSLVAISRFEDAEIAYKRLLALEPDNYINWAVYGHLLLNNLGKYCEAETAYENSLRINQSYVYVIDELIFLERDKLNNLPKAIKLFEDNKSILVTLFDSYQLQQGLFATYEKNWGIAKDHWLSALIKIGDVLPEETRNDWFRAIAIMQKLGYGKELLQLFSDEEVFREFRPMFEALNALEIGDKKYLMNVAEEVSKPAEGIYNYMKKYQKRVG
jgi:tetratricopeptide (TPR) repeat protein